MPADAFGDADALGGLTGPQGALVIHIQVRKRGAASRCRGVAVLRQVVQETSELFRDHLTGSDS
jgi:hypothetical protein